MSMQSCSPGAPLRVPALAAEAALFRALADPHRLAILAALAQVAEPVCVCDITQSLPLNQPTVSHHLRVLREAGLILAERRATWVYYRPADDAAERLTLAVQATLGRRAVHA